MKSKYFFWIFIFFALVLTPNVLGALTDGLKIYHSLDNSASLIDVISGFNGTITGTLVNTSGKINRAVNFTGSGGASLATNYALINTLNLSNNENTTLSMWLYLPSTLTSSTNLFSFGDLVGWTALEPRVSNGVNLTFVNRDHVSTPWTPTKNAWVHYAFVTYKENATTTRNEIYENGVIVKNSTQTYWNRNLNKFSFLGGTDSSYAPAQTFTEDEVGVWNRKLTYAEIVELYNGGSGLAYPFVILPSISYLTPTPNDNAIQFYTSNSFKINTTTDLKGIINTTHYLYYGNGSLYSSISIIGQNLTSNYTLAIGTYLYNATSKNDTYTTSLATQTITIYNITTGTITLPIVNQNVSEFLNITWTNSTTTNNVSSINNFKVSLLNSDSTLNRTLMTTRDLNLTNYNLHGQNLSTGQYYVQVEVNDSQNNKANYSNRLFNYATNAKLNITASIYNSSSISSFSLNVTELNTSFNTLYSTNSGLISVPTIKGYSYFITFNSSGFENKNVSFTQVNTSQAYQFTLYPSNSLNLSIFKESDLSPLNSNFTIGLLGNYNSLNLNFTGSSYLFTNIPEDAYIVSVSSSGYVSRSYVVSISNTTSQSLNAYLLGSNESTLIGFYVKSLSDSILEGASIDVQRLVNTSYISVANSVTDGTGFVTFSMREGYSYRILISYPTYNTYILEFVPYSANSPYTFKLSPSSSFEFSSIFNYAYYYYSPASSQLNSTPSTFSLTSVSNNGTILSTSITCNGFNDNVSGSPTGSSVSVSLNVNSTSVVRCKFDIDVDEYGLYSFNQTYRYLNQTNTSFVSQSEQTRNNSNSAWLTIFSFIIIILMCVGASQMSGNPKFIKGVGILGIIIFTSISWIHPVAGGVSAFIGLLLLFMEGR